MVGITNGMTLSGIVSIPLEAGYDGGTLDSVSIIEDDAPATETSVRSAPFAYPLSVTLDTTRLTNGVHLLSARAIWGLGGDDGDSGLPTYQVDSAAIEINVHNEISFPDWMPTFGQDEDLLLITAQSAHLDADWFIDVYDSETSYIGTFEGHTTDGIIGVVWNLIGPGSVIYDDPFFFFVVTTEFETTSLNSSQSAGGSASATAPATRKNYDRWTGRGHWVVANQQAWDNVVGADDFDTMTDGFVQAAEQVSLTVRPNHPAGEAFRFRYGTAFGTGPDSDWLAFRQALYHSESRNLFYQGHGEGAGIGRNRNNTNRYISAVEIGTALRTIPTGQTNRHGYRFVFLDGCETASGGLPTAFGIVPKKNLGSEF